MSYEQVPYTFRPIDRWPGELTRSRKRPPFSAGFHVTMTDLHRELRMLSARNVVMQIAVREGDLRLDGKPRAHARAEHPGVILAFDSQHGPLKYAVDTFDTWQANLRAIALALEALRKVDRYGVTKRGEQYTGWREIPQHTGSGFASADDAAGWMELQIEQTLKPGDALVTRDEILNGMGEDAYRYLARRLHPDAPGGSHEEFVKLQTAHALVTA